MQAKPDAIPASHLERHFQTLILTVITAAVLYLGTFVVAAKEEAAATREKLNSISDKLETLQRQMLLMQGNYMTQDQWQDHETRIRELERRRQPNQ